VNILELLSRKASDSPEYGKMSPELARQAASGGLLGAIARTANPMMWDENSAYSQWTKQPAGSPMGQRAAMEILEGPVAGTFAGPNAKTADLEKLATAKELAAKGADNEAVRQTTGWFKGMDDKWRFEIDDSAAKTLRTADALPSGNIERHMNHDALFEAYPELRSMTASVTNAPDYVGSYRPAQRHLEYGGRGAPTSADKSTILHELQHAVQDREGFGSGAKFATAENPGKAYTYSAGEIEARDTASRSALTPAQRRTMPPDLWHDAIIRYARGGAQ
jgi:hypothetical protein